MSLNTPNRWIRCPRPNPAARLRLFCFPFAGGGASAYRPWADASPRHMEVCPVQLPGHEDRFQEQPLTNANAMAREVAREIGSLSEKPYALFGQSMGTLL